MLTHPPDLFFYIAMHLVAVILIFVAKVSRIMKIYILGFSISTFFGLSIMSGFGISTWTGVENPVILAEFLGYPFFLEGFLWGTVIAFKTTLAFIFAVVLASTTDPSKMLTSLSKIGIPDSLSFGVTVTLRLIPLFMEEYTKISNAR